MEKIKLCLLSGGSSKERNVSFMTAEKLKNNINNEKYDIHEIVLPLIRNNVWVKDLIELNPHIVLSALHGGMGENGAVQGLLECLGIPYVGSKVLGSALGMDKYLAKTIMKTACIPVADDVFIKRGQDYKLFIENIKNIGFPVVVKPNLGGSSIGISMVNNEDELYDAIKIVEKLDDDILVEKFIDGKEVTCGIIEKNGELNVMSVLDIGTREGFYDYDAKYDNVQRTEIDFSKLPEYLQIMIKEIAKKTFNVLRCSGYGRVDMIVRDEQVYVLEINTLPGMTSKSLIPRDIEGRGLDFGEFINELIEEEILRHSK